MPTIEGMEHGVATSSFTWDGRRLKRTSDDFFLVKKSDQQISGIEYTDDIGQTQRLTSEDND